MLFAYKFHNQEIWVMVRNVLESGFKRGGEEIDYSVPIGKKFNLIFQFFSGYGQSLIEYNHYTNSAGIGIAFSNWI